MSKPEKLVIVAMFLVLVAGLIYTLNKLEKHQEKIADLQFEACVMWTKDLHICEEEYEAAR